MLTCHHPIPATAHCFTPENPISTPLISLGLYISDGAVRTIDHLHFESRAGGPIRRAAPCRDASPTSHTVAAEQRGRPACDVRVRVRLPLQLHTGGACWQPLDRLPKAVSGGGLRHPCCARETGDSCLPRPPPYPIALPKISRSNAARVLGASAARCSCRPVCTRCQPRAAHQGCKDPSSHHPITSLTLPHTGQPLRRIQHSFPARAHTVAPTAAPHPGRFSPSLRTTELELVLSKSFFRRRMSFARRGVDPAVEVATFSTDL